MRQRHLWTGAAFAVLLSNRPIRAELPTNSPATLLQQSDACVRRLHEIYDEASRLEEKTRTEPPALADCVYSRVLKIKGLLELTEDAQKALQAMEPDKVVDYLGSVKISCERAEKLLLEAQGCTTDSKLQAAVLPDAPTVATNTPLASDVKIIPRPAAAPIKRRIVERTEQTCLHHEQFAALLARAMDLKLDLHATPEDCVKALAKLAIEPLSGWHAGTCVTVDNVYVACARAMNLKVKNPDDPLSYGQALRDEGLGVDTLLPARDPKLDPPFVLDSEVRAFLNTGYAVPLPSAKRVTPH